MSDRQAGWYWVRLGRKAWEVASYHPSSIWSMSRSIMNYYDADFAEIGERIPAPTALPGGEGGG